MPTLVQFGAGNIGRGFIAPLFSAAGWRVVFVDLDQVRILALQQRGSYQVVEVDGRHERAVPVAPVDGILAEDRAAVIAALAGCDLAATAVGLAALRHLGPHLAAGLNARGGTALDVLVCENGADAAGALRRAVVAAGGDDALLGCVRASIGRMIPPAVDAADPLMIRAEPYAQLPVAAADFRGQPPAVPGLEPQADFELVVRQKLYLHNMSHACLAYLGAARGHRSLPGCMDDPGLVAVVRRACDEVTAALVAAHAQDAVPATRIAAACGDLVDDLLQRYRNLGLNDPVARVARDPRRKLAGDDRLVGAARLCLRYGIHPRALAHAILAAACYDDGSDPDWTTLCTRGWRAVLQQVATLSLEEPLMNSLSIATRQSLAAKRIRAAGILLRDDEIAQIEIADFGLERFEQIGLAIHVYVNTDRYCAKELAMEPGQICPEHRHPAIDGQPGKQETFRVRAGTCHLFLPGVAKDVGHPTAASFWPEDKRDSFTVCRQLTLGPGDQYTIDPDTPHWFVAGETGCVVSEFSSASHDEADRFTDPAIDRMAGEGPHPG
jgi:mannitol-1-phosphate/altronate dehydrogenase/D-lyxose ketol-isomerase